MAEENPPEFKFSADDQDPEAFYQEELKDLRVEKLSQRVTLLSILLPIIIAIAIFFRLSRSDRQGKPYSGCGIYGGSTDFQAT